MSNPVRILCTLLAVLCVAAPVRAADRGAPATIDAQELNFDKPANMAYGKGDVIVQYNGATLRADQARFNTMTKEVWAQGNVRLYRDGQEWKAPALYYNLETRAVKADEVGGLFEPVYLRGRDLSQIASCRPRMLTSIREIGSCCTIASSGSGRCRCYGCPR